MNKLLCLKWNNHSSEFERFLNRLFLQDIYSDGTLVCHGQFFPIHRFVLSTCSDYFEEIFSQSTQMKCKHPFIIVKDVLPEQVQALLNFMYKGEVSIHQDMLPELLTAAEVFKIKGLAAPDGNDEIEETEPTKSKKRSLSSSPSSHSKRSKRLEERNRNNAINENTTISGDENCQSVLSRDVDSFQSGSEACDDVKIEPSDFIEEDQYLHQNDAGLFSANSSFLKTDPSLNSWNQCSQKDQKDSTDIPQTSSWHETSNLNIKINKESLDSSPGIVDLCHVAFTEDNSDLWETSDKSNHRSSFAKGTSEVPKYSCSNCQFQCKSKFNMKRHIVIRHAEDKPYKCSFCPYQCASEDSLKTHTRKHTGEKPFICPHCPYRATQNIHLQTHLKTHTGEKPFHCPLCPFKASQKYSLNFHMKKHQHQVSNIV